MKVVGDMFYIQFQFYLYNAKYQQKSSPDILHIEQV